MSRTSWGGVTLTVEADFSQATEGVGSGAAAYVALWGVARWGEDVWPSGEAFTDITEWSTSIDLGSEFDDELGTYNAGRLSLTLDNADGRFSPDNPSSPYRIGTSTSIGILRPIRVRASWNGMDFTLFTGRIQEWNESAVGETAAVSVVAVDPFAELGSFDGYEQPSQGGGESYGDRVLRILDNAGWKGPRAVDVGEHTMQATTLAQNALTELKLTAASEGGAVWVTPAGVFCADGQQALLEKARSNEVQVRFSNSEDDTAILYEPGQDIPFSGSNVVNIAANARVGSTVQVRTSERSRALYGDRQRTRTDLICETDEQAEKLSRRQVALYHEAERLVDTVTFVPDLQPTAARTSEAWEALASGRLALRSLASFSHTTPAGYTIERYVFVRGVKHRITKTSWSVTVLFSSATVWSGLVDSRWGVARWGESRWPF